MRADVTPPDDLATEFLTNNWENAADLPQRIDVPCAMIFGTRDIVPKGGDVSDYVPNLESITLDCGHWIQQEKPDEVNAYLLGWLKRNVPPSTG